MPGLGGRYGPRRCGRARRGNFGIELRENRLNMGGVDTADLDRGPLCATVMDEKQWAAETRTEFEADESGPRNGQLEVLEDEFCGPGLEPDKRRTYER